MKNIKLLISIPLVIATLASNTVYAATWAVDEGNWIITAQQTTGTITLNPTPKHINPYYANLSLTNLAKLGSDHKDQIKEYIEWYIGKYNRTPDNLGVTGTIYDYIIMDGEEIPEYINNPEEKNYDSSDSYAATFLSLLKSYYDISGNAEFLKNNMPHFKVIAGAIDATMQENGLTWAKIDYDIQYLMDNVEVWRGYYDFGNLLKKLKDPDANSYLAKATTVRKAIDKLLWVPGQGYKYHVGATSVDWTRLYPDAQAALWPVVFDLPGAGLRKFFLAKKFKENQPNWATMTAGDSPKASVAVALAKAGYTGLVDTYLATVKTKYTDQGRPWPWSANEAGWLVNTLLILNKN